MRHILSLAFALAAVPVAASAQDYVMFHDGDYVNAANPGGPVTFKVCSISNQSAFQFTCNGGQELRWVKAPNQWSTVDCPYSGSGATAGITLREKGQQGKSGTVGPANSDLVVRIDAGSVTTKGGIDQKASADKNKCK
jgi:hypothetical protein